MEAVYIHIPFCKHICSYCDFPKVLHIESFVLDYLEALQREIENSYDGEKITSIYIGGGSPSCLTKTERIKLFRILKIFNLTSDCEYTFECNPDDIDEELLDDLVAGGVNRVSIGIESFEPANLQVLERNIDFKDIAEALPCYICIGAMPFFYSISDGISMGVISYVALNLLTGKYKEKKISILMYVLAVLFVLKYIFL